MKKPTVQELHKELYIFGSSSHISVIYRFNKTKQQWEFSTFKCIMCEQTLKYASNAIKHTDNCRNINTTKKEKEVPIQTIMVDGVRKYRMGDSGKAYNTKAEAENSGKSKKKVGADGKVCWDGYRYGGTVNGKDICTKMKKD
jgi:hypothetical protein